MKGHSLHRYLSLVELVEDCFDNSQSVVVKTRHLFPLSMDVPKEVELFEHVDNKVRNLAFVDCKIRARILDLLESLDDHSQEISGCGNLHFWVN